VVLDENNTVVHSELVEDLMNEPDYAAALAALGIEANMDLVCD
jgi:thioredoxin-dependent peroxiredoxin